MLRMEVKEKIDQIRQQLPSDIQQIILLTFNSNDIPIIEGRISAKGRDLSESWDLLEQKIVAPLQRIPGVGRVNIDGVLPTQASVYLKFDKILEYGVDVTRLFDDLAAANIEARPVPVSCMPVLHYHTPGDAQAGFEYRNTRCTE